MSGNRRPESGAGKNHVGEGEEIALAFIGLRRLMDINQSGAEEPLLVRRAFGTSLGKGELCGVGVATDHESAIGRKHHVRQPRFGVDDVYLVSKRQVRISEDVPLEICPVRVHWRIGVHPGIDCVRDIEVRRGTHEIVMLLTHGARYAVLGLGRKNGHLILVAWVGHTRIVAKSRVRP